MNFTTKTQLCFEPGRSAAFDITATGEAYATPGLWRERLDDLARQRYIRARLAARLEASAANSAVVTVKLMAGGVALLEKELQFDGGAVIDVAEEIDISAVKGQTGVFLVVDVGTAAAAGETCTVAGKLTLDHPLMISNC